MWENHEVGLDHLKPVPTNISVPKMDYVLWMNGKYNTIPSIPVWKGWMKCVGENENFDNSAAISLPFFNQGSCSPWNLL